MTIALWTQMAVAFTVLIGVCVFARRQAAISALADQGEKAAIARIAA